VEFFLILNPILAGLKAQIFPVELTFRRLCRLTGVTDEGDAPLPTHSLWKKAVSAREFISFNHSCNVLESHTLLGRNTNLPSEIVPVARS
jgi:hypothetical protein